MKKSHEVSNLRFEGNLFILRIDGKESKFELKQISPVLENASEKERNTFEVSPSGYGIHWPLLDEDISIDGLLGIIHTPERKRKIA